MYCTSSVYDRMHILYIAPWWLCLSVVGHSMRLCELVYCTPLMYYNVYLWPASYVKPCVCEAHRVWWSPSMYDRVNLMHNDSVWPGVSITRPSCMIVCIQCMSHMYDQVYILHIPSVRLCIYIYCTLRWFSQTEDPRGGGQSLVVRKSRHADQQTNPETSQGPVPREDVSCLNKFTRRIAHEHKHWTLKCDTCM